MGKTSQIPQKQNGGSHSFFQRLVALLLGTNDPERERQRQLKRIANELSRQKYRFYKPRSGEVLPALAKFFWETYRIIGPAQSLLQGAESSNALKTVLIEQHHSREQQELRDRFSEPAIREAAKNVPTNQLVARVKNDMSSYLEGFDSETVRAINRTFEVIQQFVDFVRFDVFFLLRKFDSSVVEGNFGQPPRFDPINGEYVSDDLKDFLEVLTPLDFDADWDAALTVLSEYKSVEIVDRSVWKKLLSTLRAVARSGVFSLIVRLIDKDPQYKPIGRRERHHVVESYLNLLKTQTEAVMHKVVREKRNNRVRELAATAFGSEPAQNTLYYTESANALYARRRLAGFTHAEPFNYLTAFLVDYFVRQARTVVSELLIVRGQWSDNAVSSEFSEALYAVLGLAEEVVQFDESLADDGELGTRLRKASAPVRENNPQSTRLLRQALHDINERAVNMIKLAATNLVAVGKMIKRVIEDHDSGTPEIILNWKELESYSDQSVRDQLVVIYKKIYAFLQLLQTYLKR